MISIRRRVNDSGLVVLEQASRSLIDHVLGHVVGVSYLSQQVFHFQLINELLLSLFKERSMVLGSFATVEAGVAKHQSSNHGVD